jgi:hypothetical protein
VYITSTAGNQFFTHSRGNLTSHTKLDITKYSLASLVSAYPWTRAIINVEFDSNYSQADVNSFEAFVREEFKDIDLMFSRRRCEYQHEWQALYNNINDDFILYLGNHDHIFIDSTNQYFQELVDIIKDEYPNTGTIAISHWPENIRWAKSGYIELDEFHPRQPFENYFATEKYLHFQTNVVDSILVIPKTIYYDWFFTGVWGDLKLPRTDGIGGASIPLIRQSLGIPLPKQDVIVPLKEQFRHFDGYTHQRIGNDICPSISIPPGFFESNIHIRFGYEDRKDGWVNLNPTMNYYAYDTSGADDRITYKDIPTFWKKRIVKVDINPYINEENMIQHRLHAMLNMIYSDPRYNQYIEPNIQQLLLVQHLKTYKNYQLNNNVHFNKPYTH